ncbi:MAG: carbohydrate ABC transporter permease [Bifidobacteriaceae bacterium]|jgi:multiple sugar transport system permease protein|nr:carbohydrate ABC transporter permease [Bifidobacteriaceae bacterium]
MTDTTATPTSASNASASSRSLSRRDKRNAKASQRNYKNRLKQEKGPKMTRGQHASSWALHFIMFVMAAYCIIPLCWLLFSATKSNGGLYNSFGLWFANSKNGGFQLWQNLVGTFSYSGAIYGRWLLNTIIYAVVVGFGSTVIAAFAGYAVAVMKFPGRKALLAVTLAFMSIPTTIITIPLFLMYSKIGLVDTMWSVILPQLSFPFGLYLMIIYAQQSIPISLVEAAKLDGANHWTIFWKIALPLLSPGFVTVLLFSLVGAWNNYFLPLIMLSDRSNYPLTVGLNLWLKMSGDPSVGGGLPDSYIITGSLVAVVPLIISFFFLQRYWQSGLSAGAVK